MIMMGNMYPSHHTVILDQSMNTLILSYFHIISPQYREGLVPFFSITSNSNQSTYMIKQYLKYDWQTCPYGFTQSITSIGVKGGGRG